MRISVGKKAVGIDGGGPRGTLYGVYEFFEDLWGVRYRKADAVVGRTSDSQAIERERRRLRAGFALNGSGAELLGCRACWVIISLHGHRFLQPMPDGRGRHEFFFICFYTGKFAGHLAF